MIVLANNKTNTSKINTDIPDVINSVLNELKFCPCFYQLIYFLYSFKLPQKLVTVWTKMRYILCAIHTKWN